MTIPKDTTPLPLPRIQLRWEANPDTTDYYNWVCHYEIVIPLRETDIRRDFDGDTTITIAPPSKRKSVNTPCTAIDGTRYYDAPYRDGAHAKFDAPYLGNPPIYVIAPCGKAYLCDEL